MRLKTRKLALIVLVGCFIVVWRENADRDVAVAQGRKAVMITRIFTGPDGLAHAEDIELKLNARGVSDMLKATGAEFSVRSPTPGANPRNTGASRPQGPGMAHRAGAAVRHHAVGELGSRSLRRRPCRGRARTHQPD